MQDIFTVPRIFGWLCVIIACFSLSKSIEQFFGFLMIVCVAKAFLDRYALFQVLKIAFCFAFGMSFFVCTVLDALGMKRLMMALEWPTYILCFIAAIFYCINPVGFMEDNFFKSKDGKRLSFREWWEDYTAQVMGEEDSSRR